MLDLSIYPQSARDVVASRVANTLVLLNAETGQYFVLEEVGVRVWELCDGSHSVAEIVSTISEEFEAPQEIIESDVLELLQELRSEALLDVDN